MYLTVLRGQPQPIIHEDGARLRTAVPGLLVSSEPRILQCPPCRNPPRGVHAGHLADEIPELWVHLPPPPEGQPRLLLAEGTEKFIETLDKRIIVSAVISNKAIEIFHLAGKEGQVASEYELRLLLGGRTAHLV